MKTKILILIAACGSAAITGRLAAQTSGSSSGGSGPGSGSGTTGSAAGSSATGDAGSTISPRTARPASGSTRAAPDLSPTMPSRSLGDAAASGNAQTAPLPPGVSRVTTPDGVSPISGLPRSQIPSTSPGAGPEIPPAAVSSRGRDPLQSGSRTAAPAGSTAEVVGTSGQPAPNPQSDAATTMFVPTPPPVAPNETSAPSSVPGENRVWVPGHYTWSGSQWTWVAGSWQRPPGEGSVWIPGHYDVTTQRWTSPHWGPAGSGGQIPRPRN